MEEWIRGIKEETGEKFSLRSKKGRYLIVIVVCLGLLALLWPAPNRSGTQQSVSRPNGGTGGSIKEQMQAELETILSQVDGAGKVEVRMTLASDGLKNYAVNIKDETRKTEEKDYKGVERTIDEQNTVKDLAVSGGESLLVEQKSPQILGVLVVADGACDPMVKEELTNVTATLLNLSAYQVRVAARRPNAERGASR
ncbi:MAG TPA: hypothetical protein DER33_09260 [Syntrophomonas sp.]|nr:hypothetical protein [Syntrophomonas sp.]